MNQFLDFRMIFDTFDPKQTGLLDARKVPEIFTELGTEFDEDELRVELRRLTKNCKLRSVLRPS